jgi:peptide/nickel transport system permease protein
MARSAHRIALGQKEGAMSQFKEFWRMYRRNKAGVFGLVILVTVLLVSLFASLICPGDPLDMVTQSLLMPGQDRNSPLGSDVLGRDLAACIVHGSRVSLIIGITATLASVCIGMVVGGLAGFYGGKVDDVLMRITEIIMTVPSFMFMLTLVALLSPSVTTITFAIAVVSWPTIARLVRVECMTLRDREFVLAGIGIGMSDLRLIFTQVLPNTLAPVIVTSSIMVASAILNESSLAFLGLGDPNVMSWGAIIGEGRAVIRTAWHLTVFPGIALLLTVLSINFVGDALNDALNPRLRQK